jgi:hypothetical protein
MKENGEAIHSFIRSREKKRERGTSKPQKKRESAKQELVLWLSSTDLWACWAPHMREALGLRLSVLPVSLMFGFSLSLMVACR